MRGTRKLAKCKVWVRQTIILRLTTLGGAKTVVVFFFFCQFTHFTTLKFCSVQVCAIGRQNCRMCILNVWHCGSYVIVLMSIISEFNQMMSKFIIQLLLMCTILLCVCVCVCVCVHVCVLCVLQSTKVFMLYFMWQTKISLLKVCLILCVCVCCCANIFCGCILSFTAFFFFFFFFLTIQKKKC